MTEPTAVLLTGVSASGKSTVGRRLATHLEAAAFIEGDDLWRMVVAGREDMADPPSDAARAQLELRYRHGALLSQSFVEAGISAIHVDNVYGADVVAQLDRLRCRKALVVLRPSPETVTEREAARGPRGYDGWRRCDEPLLETVRRFDTWLAETPAIGLWVDSSRQTVDQTVDWILERWDEALIL